MGEPLPICYPEWRLPAAARGAHLAARPRLPLFRTARTKSRRCTAAGRSGFAQHHDRLTRSLKEIRMEDPLSREAWRELYRELIARNDAGSSDALYLCAGDARRRVTAATTRRCPTCRAPCSRSPRPGPPAAPGWLENGLPAVTADGHALGALRHQVRVAAGQRAAAPARGR